MGYRNFKIPSESIFIVRDGKKIYLTDNENLNIKNLGNKVLDKMSKGEDLYYNNCIIIKRDDNVWVLTPEEHKGIWEYLDGLNQEAIEAYQEKCEKFSNVCYAFSKALLKNALTPTPAKKQETTMLVKTTYNEIWDRYEHTNVYVSEEKANHLLINRPDKYSRF